MKNHRVLSSTTTKLNLAILVLICGCSERTEAPALTGDAGRQSSAVATDNAPAQLPSDRVEPAERRVLFGDLHVHTQLSFDAFIFGTRSTPDTAYEYAKGEALAHPSGFDMQLERPLDFLAVTDHAMYMGMLPAMNVPESSVGQHPVARSIREAKSPAAKIESFQAMFPYLRQQLSGPDDLLDQDVLRSAWQTTLEAAERHNDPGRFTSFVAYEYTAAGPERENLHRNVIFRGKGPELPFSSMASNNPELLWDWMDNQRAIGVEGLAIPHNSNGSDGLMFELAKVDGSALDSAYADQRMRNEPLVEITQVKGTSETHPLLSPNDEWADFELMTVKVATVIPSKPEGSYVREAYLNGLTMSDNEGFNPYQFGLVGASDTHVGAGSFDESNYWSKVGIVDGNAELRGSIPLPEPDEQGNRYAGGGIANFENWGASGLTGVWAGANTRAEIYDAFRRKETFATSGPRISLRLFATNEPGEKLQSTSNVSELYGVATPMGGRLSASSVAPSFFAWASRDANSAPLQRLQIIKGWTENGREQERVFDVACSDGLTVNPQTQRCPDNGARVDEKTCEISTNRGASELRTVWTDPEFNADHHAIYYLRALENPTCRWSTWDAIRANVAPRDSLHSTIQERAWSSPVWYSPAVAAK